MHCWNWYRDVLSVIVLKLFGSAWCCFMCFASKICLLLLGSQLKGESCTAASTCPTCPDGLLLCPRMTTKVCQAFATCNIPRDEVATGRAFISQLTTTQLLKQAKVSSGQGKAKKKSLDPELSGQQKAWRLLLIMAKITFTGVEPQRCVFFWNPL